MAGKEGDFVSLSLIRTPPLVVGSACYTADKSVAVRVRVFVTQTYVRTNFFYTLRYCTNGKKKSSESNLF